jgi:hypothetical protein
LAALALCDRQARAADPPGAAAEALFREGRALMAEGRFAEGCVKLAASQSLDPGAGTLVNLAACYKLAGRTATAWATYQEAAAAANRSGRTDWELQARTQAAELEAIMSYLTVQVPPSNAPAGLLVERDGVSIQAAEWGSAIPVDPGIHIVKASAPGRVSFSQTVEFTAQGQRLTINVPELQALKVTAIVLQPPPSPRPSGSTAPARPPARRSGFTSMQPTIGLALGGVGVVAIGLGAWLGLSAKSHHDEALTFCGPDNRCSAPGLSAERTAWDQARYSNVAFGIGLVAIAAGVTLWVTAPKSGHLPLRVRTAVAPCADGLAFTTKATW